MYYWLLDLQTRLLHFMDQGGPVLWGIFGLTFLMWAVIFERAWYFNNGFRQELRATVEQWEGRAERKSWNAQQIRRALISRISVNIKQNMPLVKSLVALCPLLGLLGTVTGMVEVFNIMAVTGGGDAKSMAGGVSRATIPTMAGMVAALSGVAGNTYLERIAHREDQLLEDYLTQDH